MFILFIIAGIIAGFLSGLFGIGGGIITIPILFQCFKWLHVPANELMHMASGTTLAIIIVTSFSLTCTHYKKKTIDWNVIKKIAFFIICGVLLGAALSTLLNGKILEKIFGIFLILVALKLIFFINNNKNQEVKKISQIWFMIFGLLLGFKSGLLGIGGGMLAVPFLLYLGYDSRFTSGTTSVITLIVGVTGTLVFAFLGFGKVILPNSIGYVYIPAFILVSIFSFIFAKIGVKFLYVLPEKIMKRIFVILIILLAFKMLVS